MASHYYARACALLQMKLYAEAAHDADSRTLADLVDDPSGQSASGVDKRLEDLGFDPVGRA